jgi:hypothetical protein
MTKHNKTTVGLYAALAFLFAVQAVASYFAHPWIIGAVIYGAIAVFHTCVAVYYFRKFRAAPKVEVK